MSTTSTTYRWRERVRLVPVLLPRLSHMAWVFLAVMEIAQIAFWFDIRDQRDHHKKMLGYEERSHALTKDALERAEAIKPITCDDVTIRKFGDTVFVAGRVGR